MLLQDSIETVYQQLTINQRYMTTVWQNEYLKPRRASVAKKWSIAALPCQNCLLKILGIFKVKKLSIEIHFAVSRYYFTRETSFTALHAADTGTSQYVHCGARLLILTNRALTACQASSEVLHYLLPFLHFAATKTKSFWRARQNWIL